MAKSRRRWFQFGIVSLLVATTVVAFLVALIVVPARRQREAAESLVDLGAWIGYDYESAGAKEPYAPRWMRRILGDDMFRTLDSTMIGPVVDDPAKVAAALEVLATLPGLSELHLDSDIVNDGHLRQVGELSSLRSLVIGGSDEITDSGLAPIASLHQLKRLVLEGNFSDAGLQHIGGLTNLEELIVRAPLSDAAMRHLTGFVHLRSLQCENLQGRPLHLDGPCNFDLDDNSLSDGIDFIVGALAPDRKPGDSALGDADVELPDVMVTEELRGGSIRDALNRLLHPHQLGFRVQDDQLIVTTRVRDDQSHAGINHLRRTLPRLIDVDVGW